MEKIPIYMHLFGTMFDRVAIAPVSKKLIVKSFRNIFYELAHSAQKSSATVPNFGRGFSS